MERIVTGTLVDDFLEIHAIIGDIIFYGLAVPDHTLHSVRERAFFGPLVKKKTTAWWHQVHKERLHVLQTSA
jgi:hypothetical protein